jgi:hypothetical protein
MGGPAPSSIDIELPDLSAFPTAAEKALRLLRAAAAVEHGLMVQYLYAGYAFTTPNRLILDVAIEEMSHLMTVQNLLTSIGAPPDLSRQDYGTPTSEDERLFPFDLLLEPVTNESLAKYVVAESPSDWPTGIDAALKQRIIDLATQGAGTSINRVGTLYALLGVVFGSESLLLQKAATGDPWYVAVNALATEAAQEYGGRDKIHLPDSAFQPNSESQGTDREWDRSVVKGFDEFRVHVVVGRESALEALRDIGLQGEGPTTSSTEVAHFMRFVELFKQFFGVDGMSTSPAPNVARVPKAAQIVVDHTSTNAEAISHPLTVRWAQLADHRYAILLGALEFYLRMAAADRPFLLSWCFAEMFALRMLGNLLTKMPRSASATPFVAALPFNQPPWVGSAASWENLEAEFDGSLAEIAAIEATAVTDQTQVRFLAHLKFSDERKREEVRAQKAGGTVRRQFDRAREILDWAAGAGSPNHQNQGRFWNLPLNDFKSTSIFGSNIVQPPTAGGDAPLIANIRSGFMPMNRPRLAPADSEFIFLEDWIRNGCPDDPL